MRHKLEGGGACSIGWLGCPTHGAEGPFSESRGLGTARITRKRLDVGRQSSSCTYHAENAVGFVPFRELVAVEYIAGFADPILVPG